MLSAGRLSALAGLSPAATTTAIQRLIAAGHLTRTVDGEDRRRAVVTLTDSAGLLSDIYSPIGEAGRLELSRHSPDQLTLITDFLRRGERLQLGQAERIRDLAVPGSGRAEASR